MKATTIDTAALWAGTISTWQDGDIFRETNTDIVSESIGDRLGYLKAKADVAGYLAADQTWAGSNTFDTGVADTTTFAGDNAVVFNTSVDVNSTFHSVDNAALDGETSLNGAAYATGLFGISTADTTDADATLSTMTVQRVPTLTGNRVYTLPAPTYPGQLCLLIRNRTADAFTATLQTATPTTLGVVSASSAGWILAQAKNITATGWRLVAWGGTVTSLDTTV